MSNKLSNKPSDIAEQLGIEDQYALATFAQECKQRPPHSLMEFTEKMLGAQNTALAVRVVIVDARFKTQQHLETFVRDEIPTSWKEDPLLQEVIRLQVLEQAQGVFCEVLGSFLSARLSTVLLELARSPQKTALALDQKSP